MTPKKVLMKLRWLFWRFDWLLIILIFIVILIDVGVYNNIISSQSIFDDKIKVLTALGQFTSIAIAAIAISYQVQATKKREIEFRVHQQRKETYEGLLKVIEKIAKLTKENDPDLVEKMVNDWRELRPKIIIYASPRVIDAYKAIEKGGMESDADRPVASVKRIAELYRQMRSEVGFAAEDVPTRQLMSFFITDINDPQYNCFRRLNFDPSI
jgi:hypothetical protein